MLFLNSCAAPAVMIAGVGTFYGVHKVAKHHYPNAVPDIPELPSFTDVFGSSAGHKSSPDKNQDFGFDCTKGETDKNRTECFDQFTKWLSEKEDNSEINHDDFIKRSGDTSTLRDEQVPQKIEKTKDTHGTVVAPRGGRTVLSKSKTPPQKVASNRSNTNKSKKFVSSKIAGWASAWEKQDPTLYMSFYSNNFVGDNRSRTEWEAHRLRALKNNSNISIQISNMQIHPGEKIVETNFTQHYKSDSFSDIGIKKLVWQKYDSDWKIIRETWMPKESILKVPYQDRSMDLVSSQLLNWLKAWGSQDIKLYVSFYSKDFIGTKKSRLHWELNRHLALKANSNISIQISNMQVRQSKKIIAVHFTQHFKSDVFSDVGKKELVWKRTENNWKIFKETWIPS